MGFFHIYVHIILVVEFLRSPLQLTSVLPMPNKENGTSAV